jgi:hypothetical protein
MDISFTINLTDKQIPELMALLAKMQDSGAAAVTVDAKPAAKPVPAAQEAPSPVPAEAPRTVTADQIQAAAGAFMDAAPGNLSVLQSILAELGVQSLPQLKPDQLQLFAASLRGYGVSI